MPTYEYKCPNGHTFDVFQRISDEPGAQCPTCGEESTRQLSAGAGLLFKGSGFYITDYRSGDYKKKVEKESGSGSSSSEGGSGGGSASTSEPSSGSQPKTSKSDD